MGPKIMSIMVQRPLAQCDISSLIGFTRNRKKKSGTK